MIISAHCRWPLEVQRVFCWLASLTVTGPMIVELKGLRCESQFCCIKKTKWFELDALHRLQWVRYFTDSETNWNVHAYIIRSFMLLSSQLLFSVVNEQCLTKVTICIDKLLVGHSFWLVKCMTFKWITGKKNNAH